MGTLGWFFWLPKPPCVFSCNRKHSLIHHLFMVVEQPQNAAHSSGLIRFKHICVRSHWLSLPTAVAHSHAQQTANRNIHLSVRMLSRTHTYTHRHAFVPLILFIPFLPRYISLLSVLHANELSVLMPEYYRCVCLISLQPFLFPGDYPVFKRNRPSSLHSVQLPASQSVGQPASLPISHTYTITI